MKYNGKELIEMTPEKWDGKSREMLVWNDNSLSPHKKIVVGHFLRGDYWMAEDGNSWQHCAEIPKEDLVESLKELLGTTPFEDALFTRIGELKEEIADLKEENERLKNELDERIKNELRKQIKKEMDLVYEERYLD